MTAQSMTGNSFRLTGTDEETPAFFQVLASNRKAVKQNAVPKLPNGSAAILTERWVPAPGPLFGI
jgi:hypothetical protein